MENIIITGIIVIMISLVPPNANDAISGLESGAAAEKPIPRYLRLARKIHAAFTEREEKERAALRNAEAAAKRKNDIIRQSVDEVLQFCRLLTATPDLRGVFVDEAKALAERVLSNRYAYTVEDEPIVVSYQIPEFKADLSAPDGTVIRGSDSGYLHIGLTPVKIEPSTVKPLEVPSLTTHTLFAKQYRVELDGKFKEKVKGEWRKADPIADILTELRTHLGYEYFEDRLIPHLEAQSHIHHYGHTH